MQEKASMKATCSKEKRFWFKLGLILLVTNMPLGYGGMATGGVLAVMTGNREWVLLGLGVYVLSWIMLGLGVMLAGTTGLQYARLFWHRKKSNGAGASAP